MERQKGPKEAAFEANVLPALRQLTEVANAHGINMFAHFMLDDIDGGDCSSVTVLAVPCKEGYRARKMQALISTAQRPSPSPGCGTDGQCTPDNYRAALRPLAPRSGFLARALGKTMPGLNAINEILNGMLRGAVRHPCKKNCPARMDPDALIGMPYTRGEN